MTTPVLYEFPPVVGQGSLSTFCVKAERCFHARSISFERRDLIKDGDVRRVSPDTHKLPVLEVGARRIVDSTRIAAWADENGSGPSLFPADPALRREAALVEDWADESLYWFMVYLRWQHTPHFNAFRDVVMSDLPGPLRSLIARIPRRRMLRSLWAQGLGRLALDEVLTRLDGHLEMLEARAEATGFLVGESLTVADISVFAILQGIHAPLLPLGRQHVRARAGVDTWARRVDAATRGPGTVDWS